MTLLLQCFLHFLPTDNAVACFIPYYDFQDSNVPRSLLRWVPATVKLSLQPHYFNTRLQGPMYSAKPLTLMQVKQLEHTADH
jgi:hypothetical protein